jgi:hypothetical protein
MNTIWKRALVAAALLAAGTATLDASADSVGGWAGKANNPANTSCFTENFAGVVNSNCANPTRWDLPMVNTSNGHDNQFSASVNVFAPSQPSFVGCSLFSVDTQGRQVGSTGNLIFQQTVGFATIQLGPIDVPAGATFNLDCNIGNGARLISVN